MRNDVEDRDHMINTLKTKISLLKGGSGNDCSLVDAEGVENAVSTPISFFPGCTVDAQSIIHDFRSASRRASEAERKNWKSSSAKTKAFGRRYPI